MQSIESGGRIDRDGRLKTGDRIVEINGTSLVAVDFRRAQEVFRLALGDDAVRLKVYKKTPDQPVAPSVVAAKVYIYEKCILDAFWYMSAVSVRRSTA